MYFQFPNDEAWQKAVTLVERLLIERIKRGQEPMTYAELVAAINPAVSRPRLDLDIQGDRSAVSALLGDVSRRCRSRNEPLLSAFVIRKTGELIGEGWWEQARLAGYPVETEDQRIIAYTEEYKRCKQVYGNPMYTFPH